MSYLRRARTRVNGDARVALAELTLGARHANAIGVFAVRKTAGEHLLNANLGRKSTQALEALIKLRECTFEDGDNNEDAQ